MNEKKSLKAQDSVVADTDYQLSVLNGGPFEAGKLSTFQQKISEQDDYPLKPTGIEIFQLNLGYMCNQTCKHCHVDAGPDRKEMMDTDHLKQCLAILERYRIPTLDLTGGAPEMHPHFRWFVREAKAAGVQEVIVRSNLTIILANKQYHDLPEVYRGHRCRLVASLPYYQPDKTDRQRGKGVFDQSVRALQMLNAVGYGQPDSSLMLDLVYNPAGAFLPGNQESLEQEFKRNLYQDHGIRFNNLFTITNLPISRFLAFLLASDNYEAYMEKLVSAFNPAAVKGVMCRNTISVDWDGRLYDCDFNQMLAIGVDKEAPQTLDTFDLDALNNREIQTNQHCFGCTAGAGSSCQGATT
jgi:radical SAM/Cys-rich protein